MSLLRKWNRLWTLDGKTRLLFVEAYFSLGWARLLLLFPFSRIAFTLGTRMKETPTVATVEETRTARRISAAVQCVSRHTFWDSKCLVRAISCQKMLRRRGIASTLYLGTGRDESGGLAAHAWLRCGALYVSGREEMHRFTVVGTFADSK
ncbi:lasso peptide biosynthesis B2 protein [Paenibacillus antri]|uniref:Lasso peptide biosynthesis B2 protein n=1 Tax=Paenibacillus antri TaxID=2582848 RepID=A0A5R9GDD5_9BACL|nr:lasso peptide biosynthesis B2 protein [Paenibacillus antri]TLS49395.1 lasso peptide biosynthesis B2 protein [Paenibacillus antri]